jgi:hypothetical protein
MANPYSKQSFQVFNPCPDLINFSFNGNSPIFPVYGAIPAQNYRPGMLRNPLDIYVTQVSQGPGIGTNILTTSTENGTGLQNFKMTVPADLRTSDMLQLYFGIVTSSTLWWMLLRDGKPIDGALPKDFKHTL